MNHLQIVVKNAHDGGDADEIVWWYFSLLNKRSDVFANIYIIRKPWINSATIGWNVHLQLISRICPETVV